MSSLPETAPRKRGDTIRLTLGVVVVLAAFAYGFAHPDEEPRTFAVDLANAFGFAALALLVLQLLVPAPPRVSRRPFHMTLLLRLHGRFGYAALAAAVAHVVVLVLDDSDRLELLNPAEGSDGTRAGVVALGMLVVLIAASTRRREGRQPRGWRTPHMLLGAAATAAAVGHLFGVNGFDTRRVIALALVPLGALALLYLWPERSRRPV